VSRRPGKDGYTRYISTNTMNSALRALGYDTQQDITGHGFRAMARTLIREKLGWDRELIEKHLAHVSDEELGETYDRTRFIEQRHAMVQAWADYLDQLADHKIPPAQPSRLRASRRGVAPMSTTAYLCWCVRFNSALGEPWRPGRSSWSCRTPSARNRRPARRRRAGRRRLAAYLTVRPVATSVTVPSTRLTR
jgi:hypothetical protein